MHELDIESIISMVDTENLYNHVLKIEGEPLSKTFCNQCRRESVDLPSACLQENFSFVQAAHVIHDILRSDHAPFWRAGIPAIFLTDTANFRYPFYHSPGDTIDKLDFDFMTKIAKGIIATNLELAPADFYYLRDETDES